MRAYKFLDAQGRSPYTGALWPSPGAWMEASSVRQCRDGVHACSAADLSWWLAAQLWEIELDGDIIEARHKVVAATRPPGSSDRRVRGRGARPWRAEHVAVPRPRRASLAPRRPRSAGRPVRAMHDDRCFGGVAPHLVRGGRPDERGRSGGDVRSRRGVLRRPRRAGRGAVRGVLRGRPRGRRAPPAGGPSTTPRTPASGSSSQHGWLSDSPSSEAVSLVASRGTPPSTHPGPTRVEAR